MAPSIANGIFPTGVLDRIGGGQISPGNTDVIAGSKVLIRIFARYQRFRGRILRSVIAFDAE
jgi:hypothetical protein